MSSEHAASGAVNNWPVNLQIINENCTGPVLMDALRQWTSRLPLTDEQANTIISMHPELGPDAQLWILSQAWASDPPPPAVELACNLRVARSPEDKIDKRFTPKDLQWLSKMLISVPV